MTNRTTVLNPNFPQKLKDLRKMRGWSQGLLAQKINVEPNRISKYERGVMWPTLEIMGQIAKIFGVTVDALILDETTPTPSGIRNLDLMKQLEKIDELPENYQNILLSVIEAFIKNYKLYEHKKD